MTVVYKKRTIILITLSVTSTTALPREDTAVYSQTTSSVMYQSLTDSSYVYQMHKSPLIVPQSPSHDLKPTRALNSSDDEVDMMGPGHGSGHAAPGGRLYIGGGLQVSVPLPVGISCQCQH